ncbi:hypothetical protein K8R03_03140 [Candidatus Kaiserbacteria bacterium]|nr:hypothetical protein [Candidatus Kaiserbacteria bacterium]
MVPETRAVHEVVSANVLYVVVGAGVVGTTLAKLGISGNGGAIAIAGYAILVIAFTLAVLHRNIESTNYRRMWYASIACSWLGSTVLASGVCSLVPAIGTLYAGFGVVLLLASTILRAMRPRDQMLAGIERTRKLLAEIEAKNRSLQFPW